jgi:signal recognition particle subunit SRP54
VADVNALLQRLTEAQKMMKQMRRGMGGIPGMPGLPGMTGPGRKAKGKAKKKGKSGNPAKRAEQERLAQLKAEENKGAAALGRMDPGAAFGQTDEVSAAAAEKLSQGLPAGFEKFLGR